SFISGRLATKSNQIKQLIRNGRSASLQRTFKKSFTSFSHSTRNKTRDGLIRVRNIRALNGRFNTSITHAYSIVRSEERFSRNAETDLVCRLLLEKKKKWLNDDCLGSGDTKLLGSDAPIVGGAPSKG